MTHHPFDLDLSSPDNLEKDLADLDFDDLVQADTPPDVLAELREATRDLRDRLEGHPLQRCLRRGALPYHSYVIYLSQLYLLHRALDGHLRRQRAISPRVEAIVRHYQLQEPYLHCDLAFFDVDVERLRPLRTTQAVIDRFAQAAVEAPIELIGFHYALEDGKNASRPLADAVSATYALTGGHGTSYLDPYGSQQAQRWHTFERDMDAAGFSGIETTMIVGAAEEMLESISGLMDDVARVTA